jgi:hypothetical protein
MKSARATASSALFGLALVSYLAVGLGLAAPSCGGAVLESGVDGGSDAGTVGVVETLHPSAEPLPGESECTVVKTTAIPVGPAVHLEYCTEIAYATNPPSGGDHWGTWAAFKEYSSPIPREVYVHDMEHGAVVLAYRCATACPEVVEMLREVVAEATSDPLCVQQPGGYAARLIITPDPELDTPVAAAAWGATYTATCLDKVSLAKFVAEVYGLGTEDTCYPGVDLEGPDPGVPACKGGNGG